MDVVNLWSDTQNELFQKYNRNAPYFTARLVLSKKLIQNFIFKNCRTRMPEEQRQSEQVIRIVLLNPNTNARTTADMLQIAREACTEATNVQGVCVCVSETEHLKCVLTEHLQCVLKTQTLSLSLFRARALSHSPAHSYSLNTRL